MKTPYQVEILAYAPTAFYHCMHCEIAWKEIGMPDSIHQEQVNNSLPADLAQTYQEISDWIRDLSRQYGDRMIVRVVDAASIEGFVKSLRYGVHRFPAIILDGKKMQPGQPLAEAGREIEQAIARLE